MVIVTMACSSPPASDLDNVHKSIEKRFVDINHMNADTFSKLSPDEYVVFDVREKHEYKVSHIAGAIWVDPAMNGKSFIETFEPKFSDKKLVFYCSVGERSSQLAKRVLAVNSGSLQVYNLEKGIFGWHNARLPLLSQSQSTDYIHPYDEKWGRLVERQDKVRYKRED